MLSRFSNGPKPVPEVETAFCIGNGDIVEIEVAYNKQCILQIQTTYILNGRTFKQASQGKPSGDDRKIATLQLRPNEYVVQVKGTTREVSSLGVVVTSLEFVTNISTYGPYGSVDGGTPFAPVVSGKVTGFYGTRTTSCMHSIGVVDVEVVDVPDTRTIIVEEPLGGLGGEPFYEGIGDVVEVLVSYDHLHLVSFQATYRHGGKTFQAERRGGQSGVGPIRAKILVNPSEEYLVQVKVGSHHIKGVTIIESLEFVTNKQSYGPYGALKPQGQLRSTSTKGKIVGFFGKAWDFVDQLGVLVQRIDPPIPTPPALVPKVETPFFTGNGDIVEIEVAFNKQCILHIQTTYILNGRTFKQGSQGKARGDVKKITLQLRPKEYVVQVKGTTREVSSLGVVVTSLEFVINNSTYKPFGSVDGGTPFAPIVCGKVTGFYGTRTTSCIHSIGVVDVEVVDDWDTRTIIVQEPLGG